MFGEVRGFASRGHSLDKILDHFMTVPYERSKAGARHQRSTAK